MAMRMVGCCFFSDLAKNVTSSQNVSQNGLSLIASSVCGVLSHTSASVSTHIRDIESSSGFWWFSVITLD